MKSGIDKRIYIADLTDEAIKKLKGTSQGFPVDAMTETSIDCLRQKLFHVIWDIVDKVEKENKQSKGD